MLYLGIDQFKRQWSMAPGERPILRVSLPQPPPAYPTPQRPATSMLARENAHTGRPGQRDEFLATEQPSDFALSAGRPVEGTFVRQ